MLFRCIICGHRVTCIGKEQYNLAKQQNQVIRRFIQCPQCGKIQRLLKVYVYNRDKFTCQICQKHQSELEIPNHLTIHHYIAKCNYLEYKVDTVGNCVTWCSKCHKKYNYKHPNQKVGEEVYARVG